MSVLTEDETRELYMWIDQVPFSRPKRNIHRDFSDGVAAAELIKFFVPKLVDLHNYPVANSLSQKMYNWNTLNQKVIRKLGIQLTEDMIQSICNSKPGFIEMLLHDIHIKLEQLNREPGMIRRSRNNSAIPSLPKISTEDVRSFQARGPIPPYEGYNGPSPQFNTASPQYNQFQSPQYNSFNGPYMISPRFSPNSIPQEYQPIPFNYIPPQVQRIPAPPLSERPQRGRPIRLQKSEPELGKQDSDKDQLIADMKETIQILQQKSMKLEKLITLKDQRIAELSAKLNQQELEENI